MISFLNHVIERLLVKQLRLHGHFHGHRRSGGYRGGSNTNARRHFLGAAVGTLLCTGAAASSDQADANPFGLWSYLSSIDLESRSPGAGVVFRFRFGSAAADIFFFSAGQAWQDGVDDPAFARMLAQTRRDMERAYAMRQVPVVEFGDWENRTIGGHVFAVQRAVIGSEASRAFSLTYQTGKAGKLLKFRVSAPGPMAEGLRLEILAELLIERSLRKQAVFDAPWL